MPREAKPPHTLVELVDTLADLAASIITGALPSSGLDQIRPKT